MTNYSYLVSDSAITVTFADGTTRSINRDHPQANEVLTALREAQSAYVVADMFSRILAMKRYMHGSITVTEDGEVLYQGQELHHVVGDKIVQFMKEGLPYEPLVKFLDRLMRNPSYRSVETLYNFLVHEDITIDNAGYLVCYKAVTHDYLDKHTGKISNVPGKLVQMPRNQIDDNPDSACSRGLHCGSIKYVRGFASGDDRIVTVAVDPMNVVSVPKDCCAEKMRVCEYLVLEDVTGQVIKDVAASPMYKGTDEHDDGQYDDDDGDDIDPDPEDTDEIEVDGVAVRLPAGMHLDINRENGQTIVTVTE